MIKSNELLSGPAILRRPQSCWAQLYNVARCKFLTVSRHFVKIRSRGKRSFKISFFWWNLGHASIRTLFIVGTWDTLAVRQCFVVYYRHTGITINHGAKWWLDCHQSPPRNTRNAQKCCSFSFHNLKFQATSKVPGQRAQVPEIPLYLTAMFSSHVCQSNNNTPFKSQPHRVYPSKKKKNYTSPGHWLFCYGGFGWVVTATLSAAVGHNCIVAGR